VKWHTAAVLRLANYGRKCDAFGEWRLQGRFEANIFGGLALACPFIPPYPSPSLVFPALFSASFPLEVAPLKGVWWIAVSSPSRVWGGAPAEIEFCAFQL